jgi:putative heme-binding domain-containing protein
MEYARSLRFLKAGWTPKTRAAYFRWFLKAANYHGGASFEKFIEFIRNDAIASLEESDKVALREILEEKPQRKSAIEVSAEIFAGRTPREWTLDELSAAAQAKLKGRDFENGRKMFAAASCFTCHRFANEGGMTGPDITMAGARYSARDLLDQVLNPSKEINEQFVPMVITTDDEEIITGVIVNLNRDGVTVNTDPTNPNQRVGVDRKRIVRMEASKVSPKPTGLLNLLTEDEVLDLLAYVLSGGRPDVAMFGH